MFMNRLLRSTCIIATTQLRTSCRPIFTPVGHTSSLRLLSSSCSHKIGMDFIKIVPDVIDVAPKGELKVTYPSGKSAESGNKLTPTQVKDQPKVEWTADAASLYTLILTDPDAPSRAEPTYREWHHWLVGNIPGNDVAKGDVLSQYIGSGPPPGTGLHRYVFLVYKQEGKLTFDEPRLTNRSADNRAQFAARAFAKKYKLGDPIAGNFYESEYDDYVPELYKQLGA